MTVTDVDPSAERFRAILLDLLRTRSITPNGGALASRLQAAGQYVHPATLRKLLAGEARPKASTLQKLIRGLGLSPDEEQALRSSLVEDPTYSRSAVIRLLEALGGVTAIDAGREREQVTWRYYIGESDADDHCLEHRLTETGPDGLRLASFGPGELGRSTTDLFDLPNLLLRVKARILRSGAEPETVNTMVHVVETEPATNRYRTVVQFGTVEPGARLEWEVTYRWPGLWRSLRANGQAHANFRLHRAATRVTTATLELIAPRSILDGIELRPTTGGGRVTTTRSEHTVTTRWHVPRPPDRLHCEVIASRRTA